MNRHVPKGGAVLLAMFLAVGVLLFLFFSARFGGPAIETKTRFRLSAVVTDTQGLTKRSDVRLNGVLVGHVDQVQRRGGQASLTLVLDGEPVTLRKGTALRVGTKTALGEAYVDLTPGPARAEQLASGTTLRASAVRPAVEVDEALQALDAPTRRRLQRTLGTIGEATSSPRVKEQIGGAIEGLRGSVDGIHDLATLLQDQGGDISRIVTSGGRVVGELAARDGRVQALVQNGRRTLDAVGARDAALRATLQEAPRLLASARATLRSGRPLLSEARPVVQDLRAATPDLTAATREIPSTAKDVDAILDRGRKLERAATPVLEAAPDLLDAAGPAARRASPALANVATITRWLAPRKRTFASWFSNTAAIGTNGDEKGRWARFFIFIDPATLLGQKASLPENAYTPPEDALAPKPFKQGDFERLQPTPAPPSP
ncbi:MlaD family protein [Patulibacter minatonensis]|uniref:MlaD family protein n=1 Tax=Patulibacter minatonensis TaxID=298163 RepID=UPI00047A625A|nr:MlaD family protein [Patulibacter minatonensis]